MALLCTYKCVWLRGCVKRNKTELDDQDGGEKGDKDKAEKMKEHEEHEPEPKAEGQKAEEPKTGEPKAEEPKTGDPKTGEPKTGEPEPKTEKEEQNKDVGIKSVSGRGEGNKEVKPLDSFRYDDNDKTSTKIYLPESLYFLLLLFLNIALILSCTSLFPKWHYNQLPYYASNVAIWVEFAVFLMYMYSLLCTIVSCFIFSKLAYSVTRRCLDLLEKLEKFQGNDILHDLTKEDDKFTEMAQATLNMFEYWFTVHWVCYTVTSFLSVALFFDMLTKHMQSKFNKPPDTAIGFSSEELTIVGLFTLQHCFLFLYPCFKAAAVTVGREKLIKKVNAYQDPKLNPQNKQFLIQYLKNKKFGFRISFFCARLRFGFNVAYISIFIGLLGVLLKLTGVF